MAIWIQKLRARELLPKPQMLELITLVDINDGHFINSHAAKDGYSLGIRHDYATFGQEAWWHTGSTLGYNSIMVWLKESDVVIAVNTNHAPVERDAVLVAKELANLVAARK
jgi:hypothetical protein